MVKGQRGVVVVLLNVVVVAAAVVVVVRREKLLGWRESGVGEDGRVVAGAAAALLASPQTFYQQLTQSHNQYFLPSYPTLLIPLRISCNSLLDLIHLPPHKVLLLNEHNRSPMPNLFRHNHQTQAILSL